MKIISIDTDGMYCDSSINIEKLNKYLDDKTKENFNLKNYLYVEEDVFTAGFFRKTAGKHYILKNNNKLIFHGQSMKGSHQPKFFDMCLERIASDMFNGKTTDKIDIKSFAQEDFIKNVKVKDESTYKSKNSISMQLIRAAKLEMPGIKLQDSDQLSYIKTDKGLELVMPGKIYGNIDYDYYQKILDKIYIRLSINNSEDIED